MLPVKSTLKIFGGIFLTLFLVLALCLVWIHLLDCSRYTSTLSGLLARYSSWKAQRFEACDIDLGLRPRFTLKQVSLTQEDNKSVIEAVKLEQAEVQLRLWPMLTEGRFIIENASLSNADLGFRVTEPTVEISPRDIEGVLDLIAKTYVQKAELRDVRLVYRGEAKDKPLRAEIASLSLNAATENDPVEIHGEGTAMDLPFVLRGEAGSLSTFAEKEKGYPIKATLSLAEQTLLIDGTMDARSGERSFRIKLEGPGLKPFSAIAGLDLNRVPAYKVGLDFRHLSEKQIFEISQLAATLGKSHVYGEAKLLLDRPRPYLSAQLGASLLRSEDILSFVPEEEKKAEEKAAKEDQPKGPIFSREKLPTDLFSLLDADIKFAMAEYTGDAAGQLIDGAKVEASLKDGLLNVKPLQVSLAGGSVEGSFALQGRQQGLKFDTEIKVKRVDLERLFAPFVTKVPVFDLKPSDFIKGRIAGQIDLKSRGQSPHELASQLEGNVRLGVEEGQLMATVVEAFGFDLTESISSIIADNPKTELECAIVAFQADKGRLENKVFVIGTGDTDILGRGFIDLGAEKMDFVLQARPKDFSIGAAKSPIEIKGPLNDINVRLADKSLLARGAAAVALGALLNPAAAILPFVELGLGKEGRCAQYMGRISKIEKESQTQL